MNAQEDFAWSRCEFTLTDSALMEFLAVDTVRENRGRIRWNAYGPTAPSNGWQEDIQL